MKFTDERNRFAEFEEKQKGDDDQFLNNRSNTYTRKKDVSLKGYGFYIFLIGVFVVAYLLFTNLVFV